MPQSLFSSTQGGRPQPANGGPPPGSTPSGRSFEESLIELERMVRELEDGRLGLDEALNRYEQGVGLIKQCYQHLQQAEQRILLLTGTEEGNPLLKPFEHEATCPQKSVSKTVDRGS
jgi:exodeoxyribonuclease VII small subunit